MPRNLGSDDPVFLNFSSIGLQRMSTPPEPVPFLVTPVPLLDYPDPSVSDYRFAISSDGSQLIFERTLAGNPVQLYIATLGDSSSPTVFPPNTPYNSATRPDWSWDNGQVAFCIANGDGLVVSDVGGTDIQELPDTQNMIYPAWLPGGASLATMNQQASKKYVHPRTSVLQSSGDPKIPIVANNTVWAGMPAVNPTNQNQFVFAGQWIGDQTKYNQDTNYIWFVDIGTDPITLRPLDKNANPSGPFEPAYQGRAPWYSPDGNWVAFESYRADPNAELYAIFIQDSAGANAAMQVTDISYNANHAKWFPNGVQLAATLLQTPSSGSGSGKRGLYSLDVSGFVGQSA